MKQLKGENRGKRLLGTRPSSLEAATSGVDRDSISVASRLIRDPEGDQIERLTTLLDIARTLTSGMESPGIIHQVLVKAIAIVPAADAGTLYLADSISGRLVATDSVGFGPSIFKLSLEPGEAAAGRAFVSGRGAIYPDRKTVNAVVAEATPETYQNFREASQGLRSPKAAMTAPLIFNGTLIGALVVDAIQSEGGFTEADLVMLQDFAQIAAISIVNARLYGSERANRLRLEVLKDEITRQRNEMNRHLTGLESLSQIGRQGLGLDALAGRLAHLISTRRAYILDGLGRIRACEPAQALNNYPRELVDSDRCSELLRRVGEDRRTHAVVVNDAQLLISPIVSGTDLLGYVLIETTKAALLDGTEALVEMAALVASATFARERALEESIVYGGTELLERLLNGEKPQSGASFRGLPPPLRLAVGMIRRPDSRRDTKLTDRNVLREVLAITAKVLRAQITPTAVATRSGHVVVAWSTARREGKINSTEKLETIASLVLASTGSRVRFALSETVEDPHVIPQIYHEALLAVELRPWTESAVVEAGFLGAYRLIVGAATSRQIVDLSRRTLARVIEHDQKRKGQLVETLRTYVANGSSLSVAARTLGVHVHTIQYRLTKLEELTHLSFQNSEERLTLELALRVLDLADPALVGVSVDACST
jgi:GAF domain-containing protein